MMVRSTVLLATMAVAMLSCGGGGDAEPQSTEPRNAALSWSPMESSVVGKGTTWSLLSLRGENLPDAVDVVVAGGLMDTTTVHLSGCADGECAAQVAYQPRQAVTMDVSVVGLLPFPGDTTLEWKIHLTER